MAALFVKQIVLMLALYRRYKKRQQRKKRWWVHPLFQNRLSEGDFNNLIPEMRLHDPETFRNFFRMSPELFDDLLQKIGELLYRTNISSRDAISASERLSVTLRFLATGDSMVSLSYSFRIGKSTISDIIKEAYEAIWRVLQPIVLPEQNINGWTMIARDFYYFWLFPNCVGALDGKHVVMQAPQNSGSYFFNYKGTHSLVLLATCDALYRFTIVDIGASGRQSDGGVFNHSSFGKMLNDNTFRLPPSKLLPDSNKSAPHVFVADEAFPLQEHMMRPYPGKNLPLKSSIFNYRLSRARRIIENTFGILSSRWRIYRRPIIASVETVQCIIKATVCLHNYIMVNESKTLQYKHYCPNGFVDYEDSSGVVQSGAWRQENTDGGALRNISRIGSNMHSRSAAMTRQLFADYFMEEGQVPWQISHVQQTGNLNY